MTKSRDTFTGCLGIFVFLACLSVALAVCVVAWLGYAKPSPKEDAEPESLPKPDLRVEKSDYGAFLQLLSAARRADAADLEYLASQLGNPRLLTMPLETNSKQKLSLDNRPLLSPNSGYDPAKPAVLTHMTVARIAHDFLIHCGQEAVPPTLGRLRTLAQGLPVGQTAFRADDVAVLRDAFGVLHGVQKLGNRDWGDLPGVSKIPFEVTWLSERPQVEEGETPTQERETLATLFLKDGSRFDVAPSKPTVESMPFEITPGNLATTVENLERGFGHSNGRGNAHE